MAAGRIVVLDAGHGRRTGAHVGDLWEDDLNLALAEEVLRLWPCPNNWGMALTRVEDVFRSLAYRVKFANDMNAPVVSIHHNSAPNPKAHGAEALVYALTRDQVTKTPAWKLGRDLLVGLRDMAGLNIERGIHVNPRFRILSGTRQPAVILEIGFLTNKDDARLVEERRPQIAEGIVRGISEWVK